MSGIYVPSSGVDSWRQFLASPEKQWRTGFSAKSLAYSWEEADGFPEEIQQALAEVEALNGIKPLLVIPEHKVPLPGNSSTATSVSREE